LLVVGIGQPDGKALVEQAWSALGIKSDPSNPEKLSAPGFEEVHLYGPLVRDVGRGDVFRKLGEVRTRIEFATTRPGQSRNDLVMLYYQGEERFTKEGHFFLTDDSKYLALKDSGVDLDRVTRLLADTRGAQLVLLDVARVAAARPEDEDRIARW